MPVRTVHSVSLCFGLRCEWANGAARPNSISLKHAQNPLFQVNTLVFCNTSIFPVFVSSQPELEIVLADPRASCTCAYALDFPLVTSQQSKRTGCGSVSSLQAAISEVPEWLRSDEAAGGCMQHACLLLWISAPLTFSS